jgi:hypothetical protein
MRCSNKYMIDEQEGETSTFEERKQQCGERKVRLRPKGKRAE